MSSYEQQQAPPDSRPIRIRAAGVAQVTQGDDGLRVQIFRSYDEAMELGEPQLQRAAGPDPDSANCPRGYDIELLPNSVIRFFCSQDGCANGECHIFTREGGADRWIDRGPSWLEEQPFAGFVTCGCVRTA
jgi:hypothetical protein